MRRLRAGGAPLALLVIAWLAAGCGSDEADDAGERRDRGPAAAAGADVGAGARASAPETTERPRTADAHRGREERLEQDAVAPGAGSGAGGSPGGGDRQQNDAAAPTTEGPARGSSTPTPATETCRVTLGGETVAVPCRLKPMLGEVPRHNSALARFLAAAAGGD